MSYIRSGSNPEGLYIYASDEGVNIIKRNRVLHIVNEHDFNNLLAGKPSGTLTCTFNGKKWVLKDGTKTLARMWEVTWNHIRAHEA